MSMYSDLVGKYNEAVKENESLRESATELEIENTKLRKRIEKLEALIESKITDKEVVDKQDTEKIFTSLKMERLTEDIERLEYLVEAQSEVIDEQRSMLKAQNEVIENQRNNAKALKCDSESSDIITQLEAFLTRQKRIFQNKVNHGFNTTNIYQEARYILEEVTELMRAIEKNDRENMIEELADIIIFTYGCAEVARLGDLDTKIFEKMVINEKREYKQTDEGDFVKTGGQIND